MQSPNGEAKVANCPITPASSTGPICRICHDGDGKEDLTAPCKCAGSMQLVHRSCLEKWLSSSNSNTCEICKFKFIIYRQPRPFTEWMRRRTNPEEWRNMLGDILCFLLLTPLAAVSTYLCFTGAKHYSAWNTKWEASGLICLSVMLISIYVTWVFVTVRYHHRNWKDWRNTNQDVFLIQMRQLSNSRSPLTHLSLATPTSAFSFAVNTPNRGVTDLEMAAATAFHYEMDRFSATALHRGMSSDASPSSTSVASGQHRHCRQPLLCRESTSEVAATCLETEL